MNSTFHVVAIDGGAGPGKSTPASLLSKRLNFLHVDTGSHYRSITKHLLDNEISLTMIDSYFDQNNFQIESLTCFDTSPSFKTAAKYVYVSESILNWEKYSKQRR